MLACLSGFIAALNLAGAVGFTVLDLPDHRQLAEYRPPLATRVHAFDGQLIEEYFVENRVLVPINQVPEHVVQAFISAEDQSFREHIGIDFFGVARATVNNVGNVLAGRRLEGGSTITQQVAKNLLLTNEVSILRKIREMVLALRIEEDFEKSQILEIYLNEIYLGRGAYGIGAASMRYFGHPVTDLTLAEAAFLAALPKAPNNYHPIFRTDAAVARRNYVLDRMVEDGYITEEEAQAARDEPLTVREQAAPDMVYAPYAAEEVRRFLQREYGSDMLYEGGLVVRSTIRPELQEIGERALRAGLEEYDRRHGWRGPIASMAAIVQAQQAIDAAAAAAAEDAVAEAGADEAPQPGDSAAADTLVVETTQPSAGGLLGGLSALGLLGDEGDSAADEPEVEAAPVPLWQSALAEMERPAGSGDWRLAAVLDLDDAGATIGLDDGEVATIPMEELRWARQWLPNQRVGAAVQRPSDVFEIGDVVLVESLSAVGSAVPVARDGEPPPMRAFGLRQIPSVNGALVAIDVHTGRIAAMVGGFSFTMSEFNRVTQAERQPGSAIKPFVYLAALEEGYTPSTLLLDVPFEMDQGPWQARWRPQNYGRDFQGALPLRIGVERSRNVMTVRLMVEMGMEPVGQVTEAFDIYDSMPRLPSMGLGAGETTLLRLTTAYAMIANGGSALRPTLIDRIQDREGRTIYRTDPHICFDCWNVGWAHEAGAMPLPRHTPARVTDPVTAYQMTSILQGVVQRGTAARLAALGRTLAGKTGTTNDAQDAWFVGFSPDLAVGVYVGFDEPRTLGIGEAGSTAAVPVFGAFMQEALAGVPDRPFPAPPDIQVAWVDRFTGYRVSSGTEGGIPEVFRSGTLPDAQPAASVFNETVDRALQGTGGLY